MKEVWNTFRLEVEVPERRVGWSDQGHEQGGVDIGKWGMTMRRGHLSG